MAFRIQTLDWLNAELDSKEIELATKRQQEVRLCDRLGDANFRIADLEAQLTESQEREQKLEKFFLDGMEASFEGCDWDGSDIQNTAVGLGLARWEEYEPTGKHSDMDIYGHLEPGDSICVVIRQPSQASAEGKE